MIAATEQDDLCGVPASVVGEILAARSGIRDAMDASWDLFLEGSAFTHALRGAMRGTLRVVRIVEYRVRDRRQPYIVEDKNGLRMFASEADLVWIGGG